MTLLLISSQSRDKKKFVLRKASMLIFFYQRLVAFCKILGCYLLFVMKQKLGVRCPFFSIFVASKKTCWTSRNLTTFNYKKNALRCLLVFLTLFEWMVQQREKCWFASSLNSRLQYLGPNPGLPRLNEEPPKEVILDRSIGPVGAFCVLVLDPEQVQCVLCIHFKAFLFSL